MEEKIRQIMDTLNEHGVGCTLIHDNDKGEFYIDLKMSESNPHRLYTDGRLVKRTTEYEINLKNDMDLILSDLSQEYEDMLRYTKIGVNENWNTVKEKYS